MRLWPDSLAGRTLALFGVSLLVLVIASGSLLFDERRTALRTQQHEHLVQRVADLYRLVNAADEQRRERIVERQAKRDYQLTIADGPAIPRVRPRHPLTHLLLRRLHDELPELGRHGLRVIVVTEEDDDDEHKHRPARRSIEQLLIGLRLDDGDWLNLNIHDYQQTPPWARPTLLLVLLVLAAVAALVVWSSRRLSRPMRELAEAAERLGQGQQVTALPERGPREVRETIHAFNVMQERLQRNLRERSLMLAAVSHDLRTPITALRLRAEYIEDDEMRERTLATLAHMEHILNDTLAFARDEGSQQPHRRLDLAALLQSVCDDFEDSGESVHYQATERCIVNARPAALQRAVSNLVSNALRYAGSARVSLTRLDGEVEIRVEDDGPGIPEDKLEEVFTPFYRLEDSRNTDTGGIGLGLATARLLVHAHGGQLKLQNLKPTGLRASICLPLADAV